jgi:hypothetical protein
MQNLNTSSGSPPAQGYLMAIRHRIASTLIGQTVSLLSNAKTITHGVVTGILTDAGVDKLVVGRMEYDVSQLLTVTPPAFS